MVAQLPAAGMSLQQAPVHHKDLPCEHQQPARQPPPKHHSDRKTYRVSLGVSRCEYPEPRTMRRNWRKHAILRQPGPTLCLNRQTRSGSRGWPAGCRASKAAPKTGGQRRRSRPDPRPAHSCARAGRGRRGAAERSARPRSGTWSRARRRQRCPSQGRPHRRAFPGPRRRASSTRSRLRTACAPIRAPCPPGSARHCPRAGPRERRSRRPRPQRRRDRGRRAAPASGRAATGRSWRRRPQLSLGAGAPSRAPA
mmetsp:Transcript_37902/g.109285  ORF Transcript_37902/g.109285 Transcript_37902/m.109285 type:complete len:253 (-) Transcript_37902:48-806(-)